MDVCAPSLQPFSEREVKGRTGLGEPVDPESGHGRAKNGLPDPGSRSGTVPRRPKLPYLMGGWFRII